MSERTQPGRLEREREFHDRLADELDPALMAPRRLNALDGSMVAQAGDLRGRRVLDLGCGSGDLTLVLAAAGARVIALDLSPGMVEIARRRVELFVPDAEAEFVVGAAESLPLAGDGVDVILGRFILHHLDIEAAAAECARVLAPGGASLFVENSGRNPLLMLARDHLAGRFGIPRYGTADERPLSEADVAALRSHLPGLRLEYPVFDFFTLLDRQVLRHRWRAASRFTAALDRAIWRRVPVLRSWSFRVLVVSGLT